MDHMTSVGFRRDRNALADKRIERSVFRRVMEYVRPYKRLVILFVLTVIVDSAVTAAPPLLLKTLIDHALPPHSNRGLVTAIAIAAVALAVADAGLSLGQRWLSSRIGEGLIYDLRVKLFDHVQRFPIAFFTRTQTGALQSRLNNDV